MRSQQLSLLVLQMINFAGNSGYSIAIPLYPPEAINKGVSESMIGYIMCLYPIGGFFVSLLLGAYMTPKRMKWIMFAGLILTSIGMAGIGILGYIKDYTIFIILSCVFRLICGIGGTLCFTPSYAMAAYLFPENITYVLSMLEIVSGLAQFSGPLIGGVFYTLGEKTPIGGYAIPFYILALIDLSICPFLLKFLNTNVGGDKKISIVSEVHQEEIVTEAQDAQIMRYSGLGRTSNNEQNMNKSILRSMAEKLGYMKVLKIRGILVGYITFTFVFIAALGVRTYFTIYLKEHYDLSDSQATLVFLTNTFTFGIAAFSVGHMKNIDRKATYTVGLLLLMFAYFLYGKKCNQPKGPDHRFTGLPHKLWIVCIADGLYGLGIATLNVLCVPEFVTSIKEIYPQHPNDANDLASALYISAWSIGEFVGPLMGGYFIDYWGFITTSSIMGFLMLGLLLIYSIDLILYKRKKNKTGDIGESLIA